MTSTVTIGTIAAFTKGSGLAKSDLALDGANPCIHYGELFTQYRAVIDTVRSRTNRDLPVKSSTGDVLMPTSDVTPTGLAKASAILRPGVGLGGDVLVIRPDHAKVDSRFLAYTIRHDANQVLGLVRGSTVYHLYAADMRHFEVPSLPIAAQTRAADALKDIDDLIAALERVIAKKHAIKRGMMQQLLTGKTRLPGFTDDWTRRTIGEICRLRSGRPKKQSDAGRYWIVDMGSVTRDGEFIVTKRTESTDDFLTPGELVMPKDDIGGGFIIGRTGLVDAPNTYVLADHVYALTPKGVDPGFLNYTINSHDVNVSLRSLATGSAQLGLSKKSVVEQAVQVPSSIEEQLAIAGVLADVDHEMDVLQSRLAKARDIKTGMMQELLTGRTQLSVAEGPA